MVEGLLALREYNIFISDHENQQWWIRFPDTHPRTHTQKIHHDFLRGSAFIRRNKDFKPFLFLMIDNTKSADHMILGSVFFVKFHNHLVPAEYYPPQLKLYCVWFTKWIFLTFVLCHCIRSVTLLKCHAIHVLTACGCVFDCFFSCLLVCTALVYFCTSSQRPDLIFLDFHQLSLQNLPAVLQFSVWSGKCKPSSLSFSTSYRSDISEQMCLEREIGFCASSSQSYEEN